MNIYYSHFSIYTLFIYVLWFKVAEEYAPLLHLHNFNTDFDMVIWSVTCNTAYDGVVLVDSDKDTVCYNVNITSDTII
jgi:hypothetical protein